MPTGGVWLAATCLVQPNAKKAGTQRVCPPSTAVLCRALSLSQNSPMQDEPPRDSLGVEKSKRIRQLKRNRQSAHRIAPNVERRTAALQRLGQASAVETLEDEEGCLLSLLQVEPGAVGVGDVGVPALLGYPFVDGDFCEQVGDGAFRALRLGHLEHGPLATVGARADHAEAAVVERCHLGYVCEGHVLVEERPPPPCDINN